MNWETDYEALKQKIWENAELVGLEGADLEILRGGEAAFIWESPPVLSAEEMMNMARQAASEMAPEPGKVILAVVVNLVMRAEWRLEMIEAFMEPIQQGLGVDGSTDVIISLGYCRRGDGEEPRFILAAAEGAWEGKRGKS